MIHLQHWKRYIWYSYYTFSTHICSSLVMDRQGISSSVYNNNDEFDATQNSTDAKMQAQMEEIKALIKSYKRSSSSSRRRSRAHASELPSPARSNRHRHHHHQERDGGRHGDVDEVDLRLHHFCAPKTCDLNIAALRMMKGKNG